jgi:hypothetical protein
MCPAPRVINPNFNEPEADESAQDIRGSKGGLSYNQGKNNQPNNSGGGKKGGGINIVQMLLSVVLAVVLALFGTFQLSPGKGEFSTLAATVITNQEYVTKTVEVKQSTDTKRLDNVINGMANYQTKADTQVLYQTKTEASTANNALTNLVNGLGVAALTAQVNTYSQQINADKAAISALQSELTTAKTSITDLTTKVTDLTTKVNAGSSGTGGGTQPTGGGALLTNNGVTAQITNGPVIFVTPGVTAASQAFYVRLTNTSAGYKYINLNFAASTYGNTATNLTTSTLTCLSSNTVTYIATAIPNTAACTQVIYTPTGVKCTLANNQSATVAFIVSATTVAASQWTFDLSSMTVTDTY